MTAYDPETGLPGRMLLLDRLSVAAARCERTGSAVAVLVVDAGGDLARTAERLEDTIRAGDSVCRAGERELALIADDLPGPAEADVVAQRALTLLADDAAAVGLAIAHGSRRDPGELLEEASAALERARRAGGGLEVFDRGLRDRAAVVAEHEAQLRRAIALGELRLHYQPIVDIEDGSMRGIEALVRWEHPAEGLLAPDAFVPIAAKSDVIVPLGGWVLRDACRQVASWHAARATREDFQPFWLAVNVTVRELEHPAIAAIVQRALDESGLAPGLLRLEVSESELAAEHDAAAAALRRLRALGVHITIDEATADWATRARGFPVDMLKASPPEVCDVLAAADETVEVVAERVEEREQEVAVRGRGGRLAQGFLYARPAAPADIEALLELLPAPAAQPSAVSG